MATLILDDRRIRLITERFAVSAREFFPSDAPVHLVGIMPQGLLLAHMIRSFFRQRFGEDVPVLGLSLEKNRPNRESIVLTDGQLPQGSALMLVDDVLNSGRTMAFAVSFLLDFQPVVLKTAVLVDRDHKTFPVAADFCGLRLATSLEDHVRVELGGPCAAWLEG